MTQAEAILKHLQSQRSLTPLEALSRFGCLRLAARVAELRRDGHAVVTETVVSGGKHFAKYTLPSRA